MADPVSAAASITALATLAFQSSKALYDAFQSIRNHSRGVRELKDEIGSLQDILATVRETVDGSGEDFSSLETPLKRCHSLCGKSLKLLNKHSSSDGSFSLRHFLYYNYKGREVIELRSFIAAYKSTIAIALADANIRQVKITVKLLQDYEHRIGDTAADLQELLQTCEVVEQDDQSVPNLAGALANQAGLPDITEERASIVQCLVVCDKVSRHVDKVRQEHFPAQGKNGELQKNHIGAKRDHLSNQITTQRLENCKIEIGLTSAELRSRLKEMDDRLSSLSKAQPTNDEPAENAGSVMINEADVESIKQCLTICQDATERMNNERINVFEDVETGDDSKQFIVSTFRELVSAKRIQTGARSGQVLGQMSDESLQAAFKVLPQQAYSAVNSGGDTFKIEDNGEPSSGRLAFSRYGAGRKI